MANSVENYGWRSDTPPTSCSYLAPAVLLALNRLRAHRVLDLGAGNGALCARLRADGFDVVGMELDRQGVEIARDKHPEIRFHCLGVESDPAALMSEESPFDAVISTEVIEHLYSPHRLPQFAAGVLREAGHLLVTTPYHGYLKNLALAVTGKWDRHLDPLWHGGHIKFFSKATLSRLLEQNGFTPTEFRGVGRLPYLWKSMLVVGRRARGASVSGRSAEADIGAG